MRCGAEKRFPSVARPPYDRHVVPFRTAVKGETAMRYRVAVIIPRSRHEVILVSSCPLV